MATQIDDIECDHACGLVRHAPGLLRCADGCGHVTVCPHEEARPVATGTRAAVASVVGDLGAEDVHHCARCSGLLWGEHRHVLQPGHGPPHYLSCSDGCGAPLNVTRQLLRGADPSQGHGLICAGCVAARRARIEAGMPEVPEA